MARPMFPARPARHVAVAALGALVAGFLVAVASTGLQAAPAGAHASVTQVVPEAGEVLDGSPAAVKIWFTEGVDVTLGGVFVYDSDGNRVETGDVRQPSPERLVLPIEADLGDGSYIVTWRAVSEDTHPIQGTWTFQIGNASASASDVESVAAGLLDEQRAARAVALGWAIARWTVYASIALLVGGVVFASVVWPPARTARATRRIVTAGWIALVAATAIGILLFGAYSRGGGLGDAVDVDVLRDTLDTRLGVVWLVRLGLLVVALALLRVGLASRQARPTPPGWWLPAAAVTGVGIVATPGLAGHASGGDHRALAVVSDALHVAAMAVWLGGLVVLVAVVLRGDDVAEMRRAVLRFSRLALWCVGVLVVTGSFQTWRLVGDLDALRDDEFGRILVIKLVVFALLLVAASFSRDLVNRALRARRPVPAVRGAAVDVADRVDAPPPDPTDGERARLRWSVWAEVALGAAVLVVTALLVNAAPPDADARAAQEVAGVTIDDPRVTLDVTAVPGAAGLNDVHVNTYGPAGGPLDVDALEMSIALPARGIAPLFVPLRELGPGHYFSPGFDVPLAGSWELRATIRLGPVDRVDVSGVLEIR